MTNKTLAIATVVLLIVVSVLAALFRSAPDQKPTPSTFGTVSGETNYNTVGVTGLKVGPNCGDGFGSSVANGCKAISHFIATTCGALIGADVSQSASTTLAYDCALTGVTSTDNVIAMLATSTPFAVSGGTGTLGWSIEAAKASTTPGFVTLMISNNLGKAAAVSATNIGSSTPVLIFQ